MVLHKQYADFGTISRERASQPGQAEQLKGSRGQRDDRNPERTQKRPVQVCDRYEIPIAK